MMATTTAWGLVMGLCASAGLWLVIDGARRRPLRIRPDGGPSTAHRMLRYLGLGEGPGARRRRLLGASLAVGLMLGAWTGWYILVIVLPAVAFGIPVLMRPAPTVHEIDKLSDLDTWIRSLAGILVGGATGLEQALRASLGSAPATIRPMVVRLVARLDAQQPIEPALRAWADEMNDYTADMIAATLILESTRREGGVATALEELADSVSEQTRVRRQIEADRAVHRSTARWVTLISLVVIAAMVISGTYVEPYKTPLGQLVALCLLGAYAGCIAWMRRISVGTALPRLLPASAGGDRP
jgi:Flp pilus assembly protein TadB